MKTDAHLRPLAPGDPGVPDPADYRALHQAHWDERVPIHLAGDFYDVPGFIAVRRNLPDSNRPRDLGFRNPVGPNPASPSGWFGNNC